MQITYFGNTTDFFTDAFYNSATTGFDVTVISATSTQLVLENPSTGYRTTLTGTGFPSNPGPGNLSGTVTHISAQDDNGQNVIVFSGMSWLLNSFLTALEDAIDNADGTGLDALLGMQPINFDGSSANAPADVDFVGLGISTTILGSAYDDTLGGANGNDSIDSNGAPAGFGDLIYGTPGNDTIDLTDHNNSWVDLLYPDMPSGAIFTLDGGANTLSVNKGSQGTDTVLGAQAVLQGDGLTLAGTQHDDTFTVDGGANSWLGLSGGAGDDTLNITLSDLVRLDYSWSSDGTPYSGIVVNLGTGIVSDDGFGDIDTLNITPNGGRLEILATNLDDSISGSASDENFILGAGTDLLTGGGGLDAVRYNRSAVSTGITANMDTGIIEGLWNGAAFSHLVTDIDIVSGSLTGGDVMLGSDASESFFGNGGNDTLQGMDGSDLLFGNDGDDLLDPGDNTNFDVVDAGAGNDTVDASGVVSGLLLVQHSGLASTSGQIIDIDGTAGSVIINKGASQGITTVTSADTPMLAEGLGVIGSNLADTFNITVVADGLVEVLGGGGNDTFNLGTAATGTVNLSFVYDASGTEASQGLVLNLATGVVSNDGFGGQDTITGLGNVFVQVRGTNVADSVTGSDRDDAIAASGGNDTIDGANGSDGVDYNQSEIDSGLDVDMAAGTISSTWNGAAFTDSLSNIEALRGTDGFGDTMAGSMASETFVGLGGDDHLYGDGYNVGLDATEARQVFRLYQATLNRAPDAAGHAGWTQMLSEGGLTLQQAIAGFVGSAEFQATYGALDDSGFVSLLYQNVLGRAPAQAEVNAWLANIAGGNTREGVVLGFSESVEFQNNTNAAAQTFADGQTPSFWADDVFRLYQATLNRAPDLAGFLGWAENLGSGQSFSSIVTGFVASQEFQNTYGALDDSGFVSLLYQNVLGRAPAQAEVNAWLANIAGGSSREDVVEGFAQSQEFITSTTASLKTWVRGQGWQDELDGGAGTNVLAGGILADRFIFDSTEDGTHTVLDLEAWDILVLENFSYTSAAEAKTFMTETGSDVVFADQGVTITLENTTLTQIADDMIQV